MSDLQTIVVIIVGVLLILLVYALIKLGRSQKGEGPDAQRDFDKTYGVHRSSDVWDEIKPDMNGKEET